jgi:hypothetical protein
MRKTQLLGICLAAGFAAAACQEQVTEVPSASAEPSGVSSALSTVAGTGVAVGRPSLPAGTRVSDHYLADLARRAINPGDYQCQLPTIIDFYLNDQLFPIFNEDPAAFFQLFFPLDQGGLSADLVATLDALLQTEDTPQFIGYDGEYTKVMGRIERDVKRFWDIPSDDIQLIGMHGTVLLDVDRMATVYNHDDFFGLPPAISETLALLLKSTMESLESVNGGNHPIFTFNAVAASGFGPDKIIVGDGVLAAYDELGFGDVAPQAIYAHEFAHHIQFENDYLDDPVPSFDPAGPDDAEESRYFELMADAYAAYYLTHASGGTLRQKRVEQFLEVYFSIGDCAFENPGHHGTPGQRLAAARFGFDVADQAQRQGHILGADEFHDLFVAEYLNLIAPDAP